jgi:hypothetical protein
VYKRQTAYLGIKKVLAVPMTLVEYNDYRGWTQPKGETNADGYLVEYVGSPGKGNHPDHKFYISWSPKQTFEESHMENSELSETLHSAFKLIQQGQR